MGDGTNADDLRRRRAMAARTGRAGWAFKKKQLDEVRGGVRRSLPARLLEPLPRCWRPQPREESVLLRLLGAPSTVFSFAVLIPLGSRSSRAGKGVAGRRRRGMWPDEGGAATEWTARALAVVEWSARPLRR
ncbi:unnamed protein product [Miscanthus lutarioriparius]|uniref:Uncharacterized protein n=1 Tax=Miscanthus lutarioriparius TaxID=422564 RepID=A0A811PPG0_9POAL|nr:unnamed protein product [Miscanthus lutarioriparius]